MFSVKIISYILLKEAETCNMNSVHRRKSNPVLLVQLLATLGQMYIRS